MQKKCEFIDPSLSNYENNPKSTNYDDLSCDKYIYPICHSTT